MDTATTAEQELTSSEQHQDCTTQSDDTIDAPQLLKDELFAIFVGKNVEKFTKKRSYNFAVIIADLPWFMYRKMFLLGVASILIPITIALLFPDLSRINFFYTVALASSANPIYAWHAKRKVAKIMNMDISVEEMKQRAQKTGGTSVAGAIFGTLITGALIALAILPSLVPTELPQCDAAELQSKAHSVLTESFTSHQISYTQFELTDWTALPGQDNADERLCSATAKIDGELMPLFIKLAWDSPLHQNYTMSFSANKEEPTK